MKRVKQKPLIKRLCMARRMLLRDRNSLYESYRTCGADPDLPPEIATELARYDQAHEAVVEVIELLQREAA